MSLQSPQPAGEHYGESGASPSDAVAAAEGSSVKSASEKVSFCSLLALSRAHALSDARVLARAFSFRSYLLAPSLALCTPMAQHLDTTVDEQRLWYLIEHHCTNEQHRLSSTQY